MLKSGRLIAIGIALLIAGAVNVYFYSTGTNLKTVIPVTLFADMMVVLTLIPIVEARSATSSNKEVPANPTARIKSSMQIVALYALGIAILTWIVFGLFGEPLVAGELNDLQKKAELAIESGEVTQEVAKKILDNREAIYSIWLYLPFLLIANLFAGFVSSIPAALLIRK